MSPVRTAPATLAADGDPRRAAYLDEVLRVLYPAPCEPDGSTGCTVAEYVIVPNARRPRLLVPTGSRRIAAAAVRRYAVPASRLARLGRGAVAAALRTGVSTVLLRDRVRITSRTGVADTFEGYLRAALGVDLAVSVRVEPAPANRKPVLQLITPAGTTLGYAKLGTGALTSRLVCAEAVALTTLAHIGLHHLSVPRVLHTGRWHGHQVLVEQALPSWQTRVPLGERQLLDAMREVATCCGVFTAPLAASPYGTKLGRRLAGVVGYPDGRQLDAAYRTLRAKAGEVRLRFGAWHGDWAPWNMASIPGELLVWDWEGFTPGAPLGFDALHHHLVRRLASTSDAPAVVEETLDAAPRLLAPFGVDTVAAGVTGLLYVVDLGTRYLADRTAEPGALGTCLAPVLTRRVAAG